VAFEKLNREERGTWGKTAAREQRHATSGFRFRLSSCGRLLVFQTVSLQKQKLLFTYVFDPRFFY
jgi:hypothetical protein